ncbi:MAG: hypothetical protein EP319_01655 [Deltaproteobacteria bacterium]|nr:MAG: hypothetical protein EP319_01655 [Deltaproteobacteria bacterium]
MKRTVLISLSVFSLLLLIVLNLSYFKIQPLVWVQYFVFLLSFILAGRGFGKIVAEFSGNREHETLGSPLFFLFSALSSWLVNIVFSGSSSLVLIIFGLGSISFLGIKFISEWGSLDKDKLIEDLISENVSFILFLLFLLISSFHLTIATGEKPMDFGILNYFYRHESGTPTDVWASGSGFSYYYLGFFAWAKWMKLFSLGTDYGLPLAFAMNVWLFFQALLGFFKIVFKKNFAQSLLLGLFVLMIPSFQVFVQIVLGKKWDFPFFWGSTRVFKENLFAEFPIWSFSFGDFHPHVMNYPFVVTFLALLLSFGNFSKIDLKKLVLIVLVGVTLSMMNIWEGIFLSLFSVIFYFWSWRKLNIKDAYQKMILNPLLSVLFGIVIIMPWLKTLLVHSASAGHFGISKAPSNGISEYYMFYGTLDIVMFVSMIFLFWKKEIIFESKKYLSSLKMIIFYLPAFILGLMNPSTDSRLFSVVMLIGVLFSLILVAQEKEKYVFAGLMTFSSLCIAHLAENVIMLDRINSLFKPNTFNFLIFSLCASFLLIEALKVLSQKWVSMIYAFVVIVFSFTTFVLVSSIHSIAYTAGKSFATPFEHFRKKSPGDAEVVEWLRVNANTNETVLEYFGAPYKYEASRISTYSGIPSYLGWAGQHVTQRGLSHPELERRKVQTKRIYTKLEAEEIHQVLVKEKITYVVTGSYESRNVTSPGLEKFDKYPDKFEKVVHDLPTGTRLYRVLE